MTQPVNFGTCWGTPQGQDLSSPSYMASGLQAVAEAILRRWTTTQEELIDDSDYGENVNDMINDDLGPSDLAYKAQKLANEAQKDERVKSAKVTLQLLATGELLVSGSFTTASGPFSLVLSVSQVTPMKLLVQP